jgi:hypothetical protein
MNKTEMTSYSFGERMRILTHVGQITALEDEEFAKELAQMVATAPKNARRMFQHWAAASQQPSIFHDLGIMLKTASPALPLKTAYPYRNPVPCVVWSQIFSYLDVATIMGRVFCVSRHWQKLVGLPNSWHTLIIDATDILPLTTLLPLTAFAMSRVYCSRENVDDEVAGWRKQAAKDASDLSYLLSLIGSHLRTLHLEDIGRRKSPLLIPEECRDQLQELCTVRSHFKIEGLNNLQVFNEICHYTEPVSLSNWVPPATLRHLQSDAKRNRNLFLAADFSLSIPTLIELGMHITADGDKKQEQTVIPTFVELSKLWLIIHTPVNRLVTTPLLHALNPATLTNVSITLYINKNDDSNACEFLNHDLLEVTLKNMISLRALRLNVIICPVPVLIPHMPRLELLHINSKKVVLNTFNFPMLQRLETDMYCNTVVAFKSSTLSTFPTLTQIVCDNGLATFLETEDWKVKVAIVSNITHLRCCIKETADMRLLNKATTLSLLSIRCDKPFPQHMELLSFIKRQKNLRRVQIYCSPSLFFDKTTAKDLVALSHLDELHFYNILKHTALIPPEELPPLLPSTIAVYEGSTYIF